MKQVGKKVLALALAVLLGLGSAAVGAPSAYAATPNPGAGEASDGLNMAELFKPGNGIYYGTYKHATELEDAPNHTQDPVKTRDEILTPILWRVMGEEGSESNITLLSEYVLDSKKFHNSLVGGSSFYNDSVIRSWLNNDEGFLNGFLPAERSRMATTDVVTGMYNYTTGAEITGSYKTDGDDHSYGLLPWTAETQTVYLPWGKGYDKTVYWTAGNNPAWSVGADPYLLSSNAATLKGGTTSTPWWLRSPDSYHSTSALTADISSFNQTGVALLRGVRPAFKLNPSYILFASEIKSGADASKGETEADSGNYSAASGAKNFKLTVVSSNVSLISLSASGSDLPGEGETLTVTSGESLALTGEGTGSDKLAYKIVDRSGGNIVGYGIGSNATNLNVAGTGLTPGGSYTLYVWAQKNNDINSHEASAPKYFTLGVKKASVNITADFTDANFRAAVYKEIKKTAPAPILDTDLTNIISLDVPDKSIASLAGIQHFANLKSLDCSGNQLTELPMLPDKLESLACFGNRLKELPTLPDSLQSLSCSRNQLTKLPTLPSGLENIHCSYNQLTALPELPTSLTTLICESNQLTVLPTLPASLTMLDCESNQLTAVTLNSGATYVSIDVRYNYMKNESDVTGSPVTWDNGDPIRFNFSPQHAAEFVPVTNITDVPLSATVGEPLTLSGTVIPSDATNQNITWYIYDAKTTGAEIENDTFTATTAGTARIQADIANGAAADKNYYQTFDIIVKAVVVPVTGVSLNASSLSLYSNSTPNMATLTATIAPADATDTSVTWQSSNTAIVTVDANGTVTAVGSGTSVITATTNDGGHTASCTVTITAYSGGNGGNGGSGGGSTTPPTKPVPPTTPEKKPIPPIMAPDAPANMTDTASHWGKNAIDYVISRGLFDGTSDTTFSPNTQMTRAMLWTVLARLDGQTTVGGSSWYSAAQTWATANGISDGTLPQGNVTREQLVSILYRYTGSPAAYLDLSGFADAGQISGWASPAMQWAVENSLILGSDNSLNPQGDATRAEVAAILMRYIQLTRI